MWKWFVLLYPLFFFGINYISFIDDYDDFMTTTEAPGIGYNVEVKLVELGENFILPTKGSLQFDDLSNTIADNFKPVFSKLPGYRRIVIEDIKG